MYGLSGGEGCYKEKWLILCCLGVLVMNGQTDEWTFVLLESLLQLKSTKQIVR